MTFLEQKTSYIKEKLFKHWWFLIVFLLAFLIRILYIQDNVVPFLFDHGKDSLAILHMLAVPELKFIGPWTSIPGLYFGPAWYYLLAPFYLVSEMNPASAAVTMTILVLLQMYLTYKYFNLESAAIIGFSGFWLTLSKSAWNPYPMTFLTIIIFILLLKQLELKKISNTVLAGLSITASFGFHFSSAFAIFYPVVIAVVLLLYKFKPSIKNILVSFTFFTIPFIPQLLFEIKNNFAQSKAIISYFSQNREGDQFSIQKIEHVIATIIGESRNILFESYSDQNGTLYLVIFSLFLFASLVFLLKKKQVDKKLINISIVSLIFIIIPTLGFFFLHFNLWYVYPLVPVVTILAGTLIAQLPKLYSVSFILVYIVTAYLRLNYFMKVEKPEFLIDSGMYSTKQAVVSYIYETAQGQDFAVYTYQPDIYDFPYQYEFLRRGLQGAELPVEFAYEAGVPMYVKEKEDLLQTIAQKYGAAWQGKPKIIYYIVTDKAESELLGNWWGRQQYSEITATKEFGKRLVVYTARPKQTAN